MGENREPNLEKISRIEYALHPRKAKEIMELISQCLEEGMQYDKSFSLLDVKICLN